MNLPPPRGSMFVLFLLCMASTMAGGCGDAKNAPSFEGDLKALQGTWHAIPLSPNLDCRFVFQGQTVSFSSDGVLATLPGAKDVPFELKETDGKRFLHLAAKKTPRGIDRDMAYRFQKSQGQPDVLVLTVTENGKAKECQFVRAKRE